MPEYFAVSASQESDRFDILAAAVFVRHPGIGRAAVVEIEHRGDRIDAQPVDGVTIEPEQRVGGEEIAHLDAPVIVDQRAPVEMAALAGTRAAVERRAVKMREPMRVVGEMTRYPIEQKPEARFVDRRHQRNEN